MKLTEAQIERLYRFTREHFVEHYDVQSELVDHLANDIEALMEENPNISFDQALNKSFEKFGVFGFQDVVSAKMKSMEKKYWKLVFQILKDFFTIPRILVSFTLFIGILISFQFLGFENMVIVIACSGVVVMLLKMFQIKKIRKTRFKETGRKWLLEELVLNMGGFAVVINLFIQMTFYTPASVSDIMGIVSAIVLTVFVLLVYIVTFVLPNQIEEVLASQYPEYNLV